MPQRPAQHTGFRRRALQLCGVLALVGASRGRTAAPAPATGPSARVVSRGWVDWLEHQLRMRRLQSFLGEGEPASGSGEPSPDVAAAIAWEQIALYAESGLSPSLTPAEVAQALTDIDTLRSTIRLNPAEFSDPVWDLYLDTLDAMEADLGS